MAHPKDLQTHQALLWRDENTLYCTMDSNLFTVNH